MAIQWFYGQAAPGLGGRANGAHGPNPAPLPCRARHAGNGGPESRSARPKGAFLSRASAILTISTGMFMLKVSVE